MSKQPSLPIDVHTADYFQKTRALHDRNTWSPRIWWVLFGAVVLFLLFMIGPRKVRAAEQGELRAAAETIQPTSQLPGSRLLPMPGILPTAP